ncbi:MAG: GNAT family N-acetyltransferase [Clostridia bacterium]|nr:GNAT family N-acetyltransferase [Clostridia bacterium]
MQFRKAEPADVPVLLDIYEEGRRSIRTFGIDQWQNGYPAESDVREDIARNRLWLICKDDGQIGGVFAFIDDGEPTYDRIYDGAWLTDDTQAYAAVHRVAVSLSARGTGAAGRMMEKAVEMAAELGRTSVRIDTHEGNRAMRGMLEKNGFTYCGIIYLQNGDPRVAYEKRL